MELALIFVLLLLNGAFAMSETALVAARKPRLTALAERGDRGAKAALRLTENPTRFLSTIQIGITLIGILSGAIGEAALADDVGAWLKGYPALAEYARPLALAITVLVLTYFSLVIGELVPKRLAMGSPDRIAGLVALPMSLLARVVRPFVALLSVSTDLLVRVLGGGKEREEVTQEEVEAVLESATETGVIHETEQELVERVFRLGDQTIKALMVPRTDIEWLDIGHGVHRVRVAIADSGHSHYPVCRGSLDNLVGVLHVKDLVQHGLVSDEVSLEQLARAPVFIPESTPALKVLDVFREKGTHVAFVLDEYGALDGMVTLNDVVERLVGQVRSESHEEEKQIVVRADGSWLLDGGLSADQLRELLRVERLPKQEEANFQTVAGFVLAYLGRIPAAGESFEWERFRFEVVDMDRQRVDKVLVTETKPKPVGNEEGE